MSGDIKRTPVGYDFVGPETARNATRCPEARRALGGSGETAKRKVVMIVSMGQLQDEIRVKLLKAIEGAPDESENQRIAGAVKGLTNAVIQLAGEIDKLRAAETAHDSPSAR